MAVSISLYYYASDISITAWETLRDNPTSDDLY